MHGGPSDEVAGDASAGPHASDEDRERVVARLRDAAGAGLLDLDELEARLTDTYAARTLPELAPLTADLPEAAPTSRPTSDRRRSTPMADAAFRGHLTLYLLIIGMLVGIWALGGGGHFWPFYPAAGWGIGLYSHRQAVIVAARRRARRRRRRHGRLPSGDAADRTRHPERATPVPVEPAAVEPPDTTTARRFVVALFVDVVRSTQLNEALGDQGWTSVRRAYHAVVGDCVAEHGGWEVNTSGDGVLVRFEHPEAAAAAAVALLRRLARQRHDTGFSPSVRVGIHSGDAVDDEGDIIGNVVNLAARVTGAADADEILVTEHVADHLGARWATEGRGLHTLKGLARPRHLLALPWR